MGGQNGRVKLFDARMSLVADKSVRQEDDSGNSAYTSQAPEASDQESPLCLPEQVFASNLVFAFKCPCSKVHPINFRCREVCLTR